MRTVSIISAFTLLSASALAQDSASLEGNASAGSRTSASADTSGANAAHSSRASGSAGAAAEHGAGALAGGTELNATLDEELDTRNAKAGDEVTATVTQDVESNGRVVIRKGATLVGRVTSAQPRARGSADGDARSRLGVVFDKAVLADGSEMPVDTTIRALATSRASAAARRAGRTGIRGAGRGAGQARGAGGGLVGGVTGSVGGVAGGAGGLAGGITGTARGAGSRIAGTASGASAGAVGSLDAAGRLTSGSQGVFGLDDVELASAAAGSARGSGSLITSARRNVRLDSGTRMLLATGASAAAAR